MKFVKKNVKLIIGIVIGAILISGISAYATATYLASQVTYKNNTSVESALNDLYTKVPTQENVPITEAKENINVINYKSIDTSSLNGKGTDWNYGSFTSVTGLNTINVGFVPNKIVIYRSRDDRTLMYNSYDSATTTRRYQGDSFSNTDTIEVNRTTLGFESINSDTKVWIQNAGDTWYWFATK